jgi:Cu(I)/Ag(I) efflux system membrane fusion protein
MRTKIKHLVLLFGVIMLAASTFFVSCQKSEHAGHEAEMSEQRHSEEREVLYYTCGMHPTVRVSPEDYAAGNNSCPICKMDLIPVYEERQAAAGGEAMVHEGHDELETVLQLSVRARALAQVKTEEVQFRHIFREIKTVGEISYDERKVASVAAWIPGRIDQLFVDFTGQNVKKGDPLVRIYSPRLLTTQEEFILALETYEKVKESPYEETVLGAESLVESAKKRLRLWGISDAQISELEESRKSSTNMTIYAPIGGTVIGKNALEGTYVKEGDNLYQIADLSNVWMKANIYEYEMAWIEKGQPVTITSSAYPGEEFKGQISFVDPFLDPQTRTVSVRVDVPNPERKLKPGMYANAAINIHVHEGIKPPVKDVYICTMCPEVESDSPGECPECGMDLVKKEPGPSGTVLAIPKSAVLDTGMRTIVYVEKELGQYSPHEVKLGVEAVTHVDGQKRKFYALKSGLTEGMRIVTQANFLIDSQSQITGQAEAVYSGTLERGEEKKPPSKHIH